MPRMHVNEGVVFGGAPTGRKSRFRAKKTGQRVASVMSLLEQQSWLTRQCFVCEAAIECDLKPVPLLGGFGVIVPKFNAPLICLECRKDKAKFYLARKAMLKFFGWKETHVGHGWEG